MSNVLAEVIRFASAAEKIAAAARACRLPMEILGAIEEQDEELRPELMVAASQIAEAVAALGRGQRFIDARLDARLAHIADSLGSPEGGTPA